MVRLGARLAVCLLLLGIPAAGQQSARPAELPDAPQPQMTIIGPPAGSWLVTVPTSGYVPLSAREKFSVFRAYTYAPRTFVDAAFQAALCQASGDHHGYGPGWAGYGKRFGAALADNESGVFFQRFLMPTLLHQDPRYFRRPELPLVWRMGYAASRVLLTRNDNGRTAWNISYLAGGLLATTLSNAYYPANERGVGETLTRFGGGVLSDAGLNVGYEFWPEIKEHLRSLNLYRKLRGTRIGRAVDREMEKSSP